MKWRPDIEGLRGVAVLLVVLYHAGVPWLPGGFVGVDAFFVVSGYLITGLLTKEIEASGTLSLRSFYARRIRRLLPAASLTILATLAASLQVLSPLRQVDVAGTAAAAAAYVSNVVFALQAADYFAPDVATNPLLHMWSLSVEEQFYLVWPVILLLAWRLYGRRGLTAALAITAIAGAGASACMVGASPEWAFYGTHSRAWQFAVGGLACLHFGRVRRGLAVLVTGWLGLASVLVSGFLLTKGSEFPGLAAVPVTLGTAVVMLAAGAAPSSMLSSALAVRPLREIGRLSYSWYLWHWPALVLAEAALGPLEVPTRIAVAAAALALSEATYRLVEHPVRHAERLVGSPRRSFALLAMLLVITVGAANGSAALTRSRLGGDPARIASAVHDFEQPVIDGCLDLELVDAVERCTYGNPAGRVTVVLFGDSHASHWFPALERVSVRNGWRLIVRARNTCSVADIPTFDHEGRETTYCGPWRAAVLEELARVGPDVVVASWYTNHPAIGPDSMSALIEGLRRLREVADRVVYIRDVPPSPNHVPECLLEGQDQCSFADSGGMRSAWEIQAATAAGVQLVDLSGVLCPGEVCPAIANGVVTYRDRHHLTATYSAALADVLGQALEAPLERATP